MEASDTLALPAKDFALCTRIFFADVSLIAGPVLLVVAAMSKSEGIQAKEGR
jgi:hypothetical protein